MKCLGHGKNAATRPLITSVSEQTLFANIVVMAHLNLSSNFLVEIHPDILQIADTIDLSQNRLQHIPEPPNSHDELQFTLEKHTHCGMYYWTNSNLHLHLQFILIVHLYG